MAIGGTAAAMISTTSTSFNSANHLAVAAFSCIHSHSLPQCYRHHQHQHQHHPTCSLLLLTTTMHQFPFHPRSADIINRNAKSKLGSSLPIVGHDGGGVYVDLGSIASFTDDTSLVDMYPPNSPSPKHHASTHAPAQAINKVATTIEEWRSNHWIVLIDDESPIRLAIGDYLHSMGYSLITACDGPMAFLEIILWSCSWSLPSMSSEEGEGSDSKQQSPPPWIESSQPWRLPNCIISDIRMPGGIDGVQLLELLRRVSPTDTPESTADGGLAEKKKRRGRPKKNDISKENGYYDEKDEFELLDAIVEGRSNVQLDKIITPVDQAMQYIEAIRDRLAYFNDRGKNSGPSRDEDSIDYPNSFQQIPVILLTAKAMAKDRIEGYKAGANGYLPKPFRPEELLAMVDNLMRRQERERQHFIHTQKEISSASNGVFDDLTPEEAKAISLELAEIKRLIKSRLGLQQGMERTTKHREKMQSLLSEATWLLRMGERRKRVFTKEHIRSILLLRYGIDLPRNNASWEDLMNVLEEQRSKHPEQQLS